MRDIVTDRFMIHVCTREMIEAPPPDPEPEVPFELEPGRCPVHDRVCEYGCETECYLDDMTELEVATFEVNDPGARGA